MKRSVWTVVLLLAVASSGCGMVSDFRRERHLKAADEYYAAKKYKEATIEYRNALRYDPADMEVVKKLATAYLENGQIREAFPSLKRYVDGNPDDLEARQKLGTIYLMGEAYDSARGEAEAILAVQPLDLDALALYGQASRTPEEIEAAIERIESQRETLSEPDRVSRLLAWLYVRGEDLPRADAVLRSAVTANPDSAESHLALAQVHLRKRELEEAEREFKRAAELSEPGSSAQLQLAGFYLGTGRLEEAEREFKRAAELSEPGSSAQLQLAGFYLRTRQVEEAKKTLEEITAQAPDAFPAWLGLAEIAFGQGRLDDAQKAVDAAMKSKPDDATALIIQIRLHLARRETEEAMETATKFTKSQPGNPLAHQALALAQVQAGQPALALTAARDAVRLAPLLRTAVFLAAGLATQTGDRVSAIAGLREYLAKMPRDSRGWELLGQAQLRSKDTKGALESFERVTELAPASPTGPYLTGVALRAEGRNAEARQHFEKALAMAPRFKDPLAQLATMSLAEEKPDAALARVERQALLEPTSGEIQLLLGQVYQVSGNRESAEKAYLKSVELNPNAVAGYVSLGQLYGASGEYDRAIEKLDKVLEARPDQPGALMFSAIAHQMQGDAAKAREGYEKILAKNPSFAPAANNLAWMLAEEGEDLERAFLLAQAARDAAPEDPQIADTLGWVLFKRQDYPQAEALLREAVEKLPDNPEVLYHLGMAQKELGKTAEARANLERSLEIAASHPGAADARAALAGLGDR